MAKKKSMYERTKRQEEPQKEDKKIGSKPLRLRSANSDKLPCAVSLLHKQYIPKREKSQDFFRRKTEHKKKKVPANRMHDSIVRGYKDESGNPLTPSQTLSTFIIPYPAEGNQVILGE